MATQDEFDRCLILIYQSRNHAMYANWTIPVNRMKEFCKVPEAAAELKKTLLSLIDTVDEYTSEKLKKKVFLSGKQVAKEQKRRECDVEEALHLCEQILEAIEELPERAEDFGLSVAEKTESIQAIVEERNTVTDAQYTALENMLGGVNAWLRR